MLGFLGCLVPINSPHEPILRQRDAAAWSAELDSGSEVEGGKRTHIRRPTVTPIHSPVSFQSRPNPKPNDMGRATR